MGTSSGLVVYLIAPARALCSPYLCKIGKAKDVDHRLRQLNQGQAPYPLGVLWTGAGYQPEETWLHRRFADRRRHGEWFDFDDVEDPVAMVQAAYVECMAEFAEHPRVVITPSSDGSWVCVTQTTNGRSKRITNVGVPCTTDSLNGALAAARSYLSGKGDPEDHARLTDWYEREHRPALDLVQPLADPPPEPTAEPYYTLSGLGASTGLGRAFLMRVIKGEPETITHCRPPGEDDVVREVPPLHAAYQEGKEWRVPVKAFDRWWRDLWSDLPAAPLAAARSS